MPTRRKKTLYERVHHDYIYRWHRVRNQQAIKTQYAQRKYGHIDTSVIRQLGTYALDDPIMPELYDTLNLHHNLHGTMPGSKDVERLYLVIKGKREHSND